MICYCKYVFFIGLEVVHDWKNMFVLCEMESLLNGFMVMLNGLPLEVSDVCVIVELCLPC
jgi:hypothetical protein